MAYVLHILVLVGIYAILALSLDLVVGQTGVLSMVQASFSGIGAYASALIAIRVGAPFYVGLLIGMALAVAISLLIALPSFRLHDDYFVICTLGFQLILFDIFRNWITVTHGPFGIVNIPAPVVLGISIRSHTRFAALVLISAGATYLLVRGISESRFGLTLRGIREDEVFVQALGKNTFGCKLVVFAISAALAASAGSLYAHYMSYIDPSSFGVMESVLILSMVIIGGAGSLWGPIIGAAVLVLVPEALRFIGLPSGVAANVRQMLYGMLLTVAMMIRPSGLAGRYGFGQ
jgi:branched-chain amino acid transport system permease protein